MEQVILVDENDNEKGFMEKMEVHRLGLLHRALSVIVFNSRGELLLQQRAPHKYHSAGQWTNSCCSHPRPGEDTRQAAIRRLREEMGIDAEPMYAYTFIYKAQLDNDLIEHELDHVFTAHFDGEPIINKEEVADWRLISIDQLRHEVQLSPDRFTPWFRLMLGHPEFHDLLPVR